MYRRLRAVRGKRFVVLGLATVLLAGLALTFPSHRETSSRASASAAKAPHTLLGKYCMSCHDAEEHEANLAFETLDFSRVDADAETWEKVRRKLSAGVMPPAGNPRPSKAEADDFLEVLTAAARCHGASTRCGRTAPAEPHRICECDPRPSGSADRCGCPLATGCRQQGLRQHLGGPQHLAGADSGLSRCRDEGQPAGRRRSVDGSGANGLPRAVQR